MSAALMATSVPDPTASPRSAATRAGPSFTPSPTTATEWPSAWSRRITCQLLVRAGAPATTSSTPMARPTARVVRSLSPLTSRHRSPSRVELVDRLGGRRPDRVGEGQGPEQPAVRPDQHRRLGPDSRSRHHRTSGSGTSDLAVGQQPVAARRPPGGRRPALGAQPGPGRELLRPPAERADARRAASSHGAAAMACSEACSTAPARPQQLGRRHPGLELDGGHAASGPR